MRAVNLGQPLSNSFEQWVTEALREIERASYEEAAEVSDSFTITGIITETRTLDATSPTVGNVVAVLATFISDLKKRGSKRID